jgi:gamma-glutamylcyclotransferase
MPRRHACHPTDLPVKSIGQKTEKGHEMYYFAYGSNMDWPQMRRRCPSVKFVCVARLPNYRFAIARHSRLRDCGTANIFQESGAEVWGVVYDISLQDFAALDRFEDGYRRESAFVQALNNGDQPLEALVYIAQRENGVPLPNLAYKRHITDGARHWQLPQDYRDMLEKIEVAGF